MSFHFKIVTPEKVALEKLVDEVMLHGVDGYFNIFTNHSPFVSQLYISTGYYIKDQKLYGFAIKGGYSNMNNNELTVITSQYIEDDVQTEMEAYDKSIALLDMTNQEVYDYFNK